MIQALVYPSVPLPTRLLVTILAAGIAMFGTYAKKEEERQLDLTGVVFALSYPDALAPDARPAPACTVQPRIRGIRVESRVSVNERGVAHMHSVYVILENPIGGAVPDEVALPTESTDVVEWAPEDGLAIGPQGDVLLRL